MQTHTAGVVQLLHKMLQVLPPACGMGAIVAKHASSLCLMSGLHSPCDTIAGMERATAMRDARMGRIPSAMVSHSPREAAVAARLLSPDPRDRPSSLQLLAILQVLWGPEAADAGATTAAGDLNQLRGSQGQHANVQAPQPPHHPSYPQAHQGPRAMRTSVSQLLLPMLPPAVVAPGEAAAAGLGDAGGAGFGAHAHVACTGTVEVDTGAELGIGSMAAAAAVATVVAAADASPGQVLLGADVEQTGLEAAAARSGSAALFDRPDCVMCEVCDVGTQTDGPDLAAACGAACSKYEYEGAMYTGEQLVQMLRQRDAQLQVLRS